MRGPKARPHEKAAVTPGAPCGILMDAGLESRHRAGEHPWTRTGTGVTHTGSGRAGGGRRGQAGGSRSNLLAHRAHTASWRRRRSILMCRYDQKVALFDPLGFLRQQRCVLRDDCSNLRLWGGCPLLIFLIGCPDQSFLPNRGQGAN